jgi:CheY-like chemotaxis protein
MISLPTGVPPERRTSGGVAVDRPCEIVMAQFKVTPTHHLIGRKLPGRRISLIGVSVLIVEDEPLIALDLHAALSAAGAGIMAATDTAEALRLIRRNDVSVAVLDIGLGDRDCMAVCQALLHHGVPFLFHTGQSNASMLDAWPQAPVLAKPARAEEIVARVADLAH